MSIHLCYSISLTENKEKQNRLILRRENTHNFVYSVNGDFFFFSLLLNVTALLFVPVCVWFIELLKHAKVGGDAKLKTPNPNFSFNH